MKRPPRQGRRAGIRGSIPPIALITLITLKLTGVIAWSWWWVLSPLWIGGIAAVLGLVVLAVALYWHARRRMRRWVRYFTSGEWLREGLVPPKADVDAPDADPGEGQAPHAP